MTQLVYTQNDAVPFVLTDTSGNGVTGITFIDGDVQLSTYDDATDTYNTAVNIGLECNGISDNGFYYWKPSLVSQVEHSKIMIFINDSANTRFVENRLILDVGGDPAKLNSRLRG